MEPDIDDGKLDSFLTAHEPVEFAFSYAPGELFGDWRVTAFLGRGGSGEVYRVVHALLGIEAALKVCVRDPERDDARDAAVCDRFRREAKLLAGNVHPAFPRFLGFGECEGRPWYVMELLEHRLLPTDEKGVARFLIAIASGVRHLHSLGLIHRDIKPANILWRDLAPVIIDLGLVKDTSAVRGHSGESLSIVDGNAVGVGTPRYAAPEQLTGDEITPATDVYALGMLANDCFEGKPPRAWRRIIQRATAAIPAQRYATAAAFIGAIRMLRVRIWVVVTFVLIVAAFVTALLALYPTPSEEPASLTAKPSFPAPEPSIAVKPLPFEVAPPVIESKSEKTTWQELCGNFTTNIMTWHIEKRQRRISLEENMTMPANVPRFDVISWAETNKVNAVQVNLNGRTVAFNEPIDLCAGREYWIVGPGVLDAQFSASSTATVHIVNCIFRNRTSSNPERAGINYVLDGGAYLNFMELPATESMKLKVGARIRINGMSEGRRWWRIKGPEDLLELIDEDNKSPIYSATMEPF